MVAAGGRPRRRGDLHREAVALIVPGDHTLGMAPRRTTFLVATVDRGIVIELIVPDHIVKRAVVDLVESGADRIGVSVAGADASLLQRRLVTRSIDKLLTEKLIVLNVAAEGAHALAWPGAARERSGVEFEDEPPGDGMSFIYEGRGDIDCRDGWLWLRVDDCGSVRGESGQREKDDD